MMEKKLKLAIFFFCGNLTLINEYLFVKYSNFGLLYFSFYYFINKDYIFFQILSLIILSLVRAKPIGYVGNNSVTIIRNVGVFVEKFRQYVHIKLSFSDKKRLKFFYYMLQNLEFLPMICNHWISHNVVG